VFEDRRIRAQLLKGTLPLLILATLRDGELHGYHIVRRIRERSGDALTPSEGSLYPTLHRLEAEGALEATWRDGGGWATPAVLPVDAAWADGSRERGAGLGDVRGGVNRVALDGAG